MKLEVLDDATSVARARTSTIAAEARAAVASRGLFTLPGKPMALAPLVYTTWNRVMNFDPQAPIWPNRDRFVLSNGYSSMLLWSVLHLRDLLAGD